jgi:hypothetical protein
MLLLYWYIHIFILSANISSRKGHLFLEADPVTSTIPGLLIEMQMFTFTSREMHLVHH